MLKENQPELHFFNLDNNVPNQEESIKIQNH